MTLDDFRKAVIEKLHEPGYCNGMSDDRIREGVEENEDIIKSTFKEIPQRGETWCVGNAAWNVSLCI